MLKESRTPEAGAVMKLVTWKYHDNPQYIGGTITGELVSIETIQADHLGKYLMISKMTSRKAVLLIKKKEFSIS